MSPVAWGIWRVGTKTGEDDEERFFDDDREADVTETIEEASHDEE